MNPKSKAALQVPSAVTQSQKVEVSQIQKQSADDADLTIDADEPTALISKQSIRARIHWNRAHNKSAEFAKKLGGFLRNSTQQQLTMDTIDEANLNELEQISGKRQHNRSTLNQSHNIEDIKQLLEKSLPTNQ